MHDSDPLRWAHELVRAHTRGRVIDVGCGEGRFLPHDGIGVDRDPSRVAIARKRSHRVAVADAHTLPFADQSFETAYAHRMLNDAGRIDDVLAEIGRVLTPAGRLLIFTRARPGEGDRLDRENGERRLRGHFDHTLAILHPTDDRAAFFVAERPRTPARVAPH